MSLNKSKKIYLAEYGAELVGNINIEGTVFVVPFKYVKDFDDYEKEIGRASCWDRV